MAGPADAGSPAFADDASYAAIDGSPHDGGADGDMDLVLGSVVIDEFDKWHIRPGCSGIDGMDAVD
jgi:hypothetical protein